MHLPAMGMPKLWVDDQISQFFDQNKRFLGRHTLYPFAFALADIEALAACVRVCANDWMGHRWLLAT